MVNRTIDFNINNINYTVTTDNNGIASLNLNLNIGKYMVNAYFKGDDSYSGFNLSDNIEILPTVKASDISKFYKGSAPYTAQFLNSEGKALSNKDVTITLNGKTYTKKTNNNGIASLLVDLKPGSYKITAFDPLTGYKLTTNFNILSTIAASNINQVAGDNKKFKAKFFKSNGKALSKKIIKFKINGKTYKAKTSKNGIISLKLKKFKTGTYNIVCYNRDGISKSFKVKIFKRKASTSLTAKSYTFYLNESRSIKVKLSTALGDNSNSGKIIKITIGGEAYYRKTDSNGEVNLPLTSFGEGVYEVEYKYSGDKFFKSSRDVKYITIINTQNTYLTVASTKSFGYGAGTLFKVALTAGYVPLIKKTVIFTINGKKYNQSTNVNGIASVPLNLKIGKYNVTYSYLGDSKVDGCSASCEINVFKRSASKLTWSSGNSYKDSSQTFKVFLSDLKNNPIRNEKVSLTIDSKTYSDKTNSKGYAVFKNDVAFGAYKVKFAFEGSNNYLSGVGSKSVNVELSKFGNGLNEKKSASSLKSLLKSSKNCKVGSKTVKNLIKSLTKGLTNKIDKAKAIFNYVRDYIIYDFYYNSHFGSSGTLKAKKGNCVDKAHLLVSMYRTAGFKARYVHGKCKFISGHVYGHVWCQVHIGKYWVCADSSSCLNSLGKINNWKTNSYIVHNKYTSMPF